MDLAFGPVHLLSPVRATRIAEQRLDTDHGRKRFDTALGGAAVSQGGDGRQTIPGNVFFVSSMAEDPVKSLSLIIRSLCSSCLARI